MDDADIINRFSFHPANQRTAAAHDAVRSMCLDMAEALNKSLPEGREKSLAITHLEEVMLWSNAAIAREQRD